MTTLLNKYCLLPLAPALRRGLSSRHFPLISRLFRYTGRWRHWLTSRRPAYSVQCICSGTTIRPYVLFSCLEPLLSSGRTIWGEEDHNLLYLSLLHCNQSRPPTLCWTGRDLVNQWRHHNVTGFLMGRFWDDSTFSIEYRALCLTQRRASRSMNSRRQFSSGSVWIYILFLACLLVTWFSFLDCCQDVVIFWCLIIELKRRYLKI